MISAWLLFPNPAPFQQRLAMLSLPLRPYLESLNRPLRVVVTGGRDYDDAEHVSWALDGLWRRYGIDMLAEGDARGADRLAHDWAVSVGIRDRQTYPADWDRWGLGAGHRRNRYMLQKSVPDLVVAFPGGRGTENCVQTAGELAIRVWRVP